MVADGLRVGDIVSFGRRLAFLDPESLGKLEQIVECGALLGPVVIIDMLQGGEWGSVVIK